MSTYLKKTAQALLEELNISQWVVAVPQQGRQILGVPLDHQGKLIYPPNVLDAMEENPWLVLCPALEFAAEYTQMQNPSTGELALVKMPMVAGVDFVMSALVPQYVKPTRVYFLADAEEGDRKEYEKMIRTALDNMVLTKARRSGIVPPSGGGGILMGNGR